MKKKTAAHIRLGREGERLARRFLEFTLGYELIEHNLKLHSAEIDLLMRDGKTFVLVEVKSTRWRGEEYHPGLHYTTEQQIRQRRAVHELERKFGTREFPFRHDLVEVFFGRFFPVRIHHVPDYFNRRVFAAGRKTEKF